MLLYRLALRLWIKSRPHRDVKWGEVRVYLWTHKINSLTESDFVMAAKIDRTHVQLTTA